LRRAAPATATFAWSTRRPSPAPASRTSPRPIDIVVGAPGESEKLEEDLYDAHERAMHSGVEGVLRLDAVAKRPVTKDDIDDLEALIRDGGAGDVRGRVFGLLSACLGETDQADLATRDDCDGARLAASARPQL
jgi:hypothetical protein